MSTFDDVEKGAVLAESLVKRHPAALFWLLAFGMFVSISAIVFFGVMASKAVTDDDMHAAMGELRMEFKEFRVEMRAEIKGLRAELLEFYKAKPGGG